MVEAGPCFLMSEPPQIRTMNSTEMMISPNLTPKRFKAVKGNRDLDLTLQIYSYKVGCTVVCRHTYIPGSALLLFRRNSRHRGCTM